MNIAPAKSYLVDPYDVPPEKLDLMIKQLEELAVARKGAPYVAKPCSHPTSPEKTGLAVKDTFERIVIAEPVKCKLCDRGVEELVPDSTTDKVLTHAIDTLKAIKGLKSEICLTDRRITPAIRDALRFQNAYLLVPCGHGASLTQASKLTCQVCDKSAESAINHSGLRQIAFIMSGLFPYINQPPRPFPSPIPRTECVKRFEEACRRQLAQINPATATVQDVQQLFQFVKYLLYKADLWTNVLSFFKFILALNNDPEVAAQFLSEVKGLDPRVVEPFKEFLFTMGLEHASGYKIADSLYIARILKNAGISSDEIDVACIKALVEVPHGLALHVAANLLSQLIPEVTQVIADELFDSMQTGMMSPSRGQPYARDLILIETSLGIFKSSMNSESVKLTSQFDKLLGVNTDCKDLLIWRFAAYLISMENTDLQEVGIGIILKALEKESIHPDGHDITLYIAKRLTALVKEGSELIDIETISLLIAQHLPYALPYIKAQAQARGVVFES